MSFRCQWCDKTVWATMYRVVAKKRDKIYSQEKIKYVKGEKTIQTKTSKGWEIVEEIEVCKKCKQELDEQNSRKVSIGQ